MKLTDYLEGLEARGKLFFTVSELEKSEVSLSKKSIPMSLSRLASKGRVKMIRRGFGIILSLGKEPHPSYYLDEMMSFLEVNYYISYLTSASYWGASHQASMSYQVNSSKLLKDINFQRGRIEFITKTSTFPDKWIKRVAATGGYINIATPELTIIELLKSVKHGGYLNNVASVISELIERTDGRKMISICHEDFVPTVTLQRLGYLLDVIFEKKTEANYVYRVLTKRNFSPKLIDHIEKDTVKLNEFPYNSKWNIYINSEVELD